MTKIEEVASLQQEIRRLVARQKVLNTEIRANCTHPAPKVWYPGSGSGVTCCICPDCGTEERYYGGSLPPGCRPKLDALVAVSTDQEEFLEIRRKFNVV